MKLSTFSACFLSLLVAHLASGATFASALVSPPTDAASKPVLTRINGGAQVRASRWGLSKGPVNPAAPSSPATRRQSAIVPVDELSAETTDGTGIKSWWGKIRASMSTGEDGVTLKEKLAKKGFAAFATYIFLGNLSCITLMSLSWYGFSVQTGMSPLFPGQWKPFLAVFSGSLAIDAMLKPARLALSLAVTPLVERAMGWLKRKCNGSQGLTTGLVFGWIIVSAVGFLTGGVTLASTVAGVPIFAP